MKHYYKFVRLSCLMLALSYSAVLIPSSVIAQTEASVVEETVCLTIGHRWNGSNEERAQIESVPVPLSFQERFHGGGCARFQLLLDSLFNWHIRYGSARSALAAGRFFERELNTRVPPSFSQDFAAAWHLSMRDARALYEREKKRNPDKDDAQILRELDVNLIEITNRHRLSDYQVRLENLRFVSGEYARAAEEFLSRDLLEAAQRLHQPEYRVDVFLDDEAEKGPVEGFMAERIRPQHRSDRKNPELRELVLAVVEAAIERNAASIKAADAISRRLYSPDNRILPYPDLLTFIQTAYETDAATCRADERNSDIGYEERCNENRFEQYALGFWFNRSRLELLARELGRPLEPLDRAFSRGGATPRTVDLFVRRAWHQGMRYGEVAAPPEAVRLLIWLAEAEAQPHVAPCRPESQNLRKSMDEALGALARAHDLAGPVDQPWLSGKIAQSNVRIYEQFTSCGAEIPEDRHWRAYLFSKKLLDIYPALERINGER